MLPASSKESRLASFARRLLAADSFESIALAFASLIRSRVHGAHVALFWSSSAYAVARHERLRCAPRRARAWADPLAALEVFGATARASSKDRGETTLYSRALEVSGPGCAIVQIGAAREALSALTNDAMLTQAFALLAQHVSRALETRRLRSSVRKLGQAERLQRALYAISDLAGSTQEQSEVLRQMHGIVGSLMYAENFFIVLYDAGRKLLRFAYFADIVDTDIPDPHVDLGEERFANTLTVALLHRGEPLMGSSAEVSARLGLDHDGSSGPESEAWLGVPMISDGAVRGAVVVQSYDKAMRYRASDRTLLGYVAQHILSALTRRHAREELEMQVQRRTAELAQANSELVAEVHERKIAERLQAALFRIAELTNTTANINEFYAAVHAVIGKLLYAQNFYVALLVDEGRAFDFPYAVDELDPNTLFQRRELRRGFTEYVLRSGQPLLLDRASLDRLVSLGEVVPIGSLSVGWLGVPLILNGQAAGVLVVQSYTPGISYTTRDQELLTFVSLHIATALERWQAQDSLRVAYAELQRRIDELHRAQTELIENEKMASLGRLVAGVAHEINTPLGIGVTAASHLNGIFASIEQTLGDATPPDLRSMLANGRRCVELVLNNLGKAGQLVKSFKQVAVDQTDEVRRRIAVRPYLDEVLTSLHPRLKSTPHRVEVDCPESIELDTFPGALYQIVANLVLNALTHAFDGDRIGHIRIQVRSSGDMLELIVADDGKGMSEDVRRRVFEPFFTTRRGSGGTGLGLHLVYNLVTQLLRGSIVCTSSPGNGTQLTMRLPLVAPGTIEPKAIYETTAIQTAT